MIFWRKTLTSPRLRKKKQKAFFSKILIGVFSLSIIFFGLRFVLNFDYFSIKSVLVKGVDGVLAEKIKFLVDDSLSSKNSWFFGNKNFMFLDKTDILASVSEGFKDVGEVKISLSGLNTLVVDIKQREPFALWCSMNEKSNCIVVDETGYAFSDEKNDNLLLLIKYYVEKNPKKGLYIMDTNLFEWVKSIIRVFNEAGFQVVSISKNLSDYFVVLKDQTEIRLSENENLKNIVSRFLSVKADFEKNGNWPPKYVDFRYGNKIFLKQK